MHTDEAVNAYIVGQLLRGEPFTYDAQDRHGPALAAIALPLAWMQGARSFSELTESELRVTSVVAGTVTILLFGAAAEIFGLIPCLVAALLFAVAPLPVYYDRYFIHESMFCAATFGLILSGWRACKTSSALYAAVAGGCAGSMLACKETAILHLFALMAAAVVFNLRSLRGMRSAKVLRAGRLLPAAVVTFLAVIVVLFTWFGRNWKSLLELSRAGANVLARAGGQGHEQPFWYYGKLLTGGWSGGLLFAFACAGVFIAIKRRGGSVHQWMGCYGLLLAAIYSLIPYKTPWLALNLWLPLAIFAGMTVELLWRRISKQFGRRAAIPALCGLAFAGVLIGHDTRQRVFRQPAEESNPYAYAHTSEDILGLPLEIAEIARRDGIHSPRIVVIASDPWPLPWYLRHFNQVGFWQPGQQVADGDFYVTSTEAADQYAERLRRFRPDFFGSRPGVLILLWLPEPGMKSHG